MGDIVDDAQEMERILIEHALFVRRESGPRGDGNCLFCEAETGDISRRWCDAFCRDQWELRKKKK